MANKNKKPSKKTARVDDLNKKKITKVGKVYRGKIKYIDKDTKPEGTTL